MFQKVFNLSFSLKGIPSDEAGAGKGGGRIQEDKACFLVKTTFREDDTHHTGFGFGQCFGGKEGLWEGILNGGKKDAMVSKEGSLAGDRACSNQDALFLGLFFECM